MVRLCNLKVMLQVQEQSRLLLRTACRCQVLSCETDFQVFSTCMMRMSKSDFEKGYDATCGKISSRQVTAVFSQSSGENLVMYPTIQPTECLGFIVRS